LCPSVNSNNPTPQNNYAPPTTTGGNNESNLMEATFPSLDSSDLKTWLEDSEHSEHMLSTYLPASQHLTENSVHGEPNQEMVVQDIINTSDSFDRIADNTLKEFCEFYTKRN